MQPKKLNRIFWIAAILLALGANGVQAQSKLSIDKVYSTYLRNSGTIMENNQIKGYFFLYQSDKIDRFTNEYTLQILDQNLNKVQSIKFDDSRDLNLLEAAYNGNSLSFLFKNSETKTLDMKVYSLEGKLKYTYSREYDKKTEALMQEYEAMHTDEGTNQNVFDISQQGYASVLPLREGKQRTYQLDYYSSVSKKQWTYVPVDDEERYAQAEFLGNTDSLIILEVWKKSRMTSGNMTATLVGINFATRKKAWEMEDTDERYTFVPTNVVPEKATGRIIVMGTYFERNANIAKDASKGLAVFIIDSKGKVLEKTYNSWATDFAKYLPVNVKGKIDNIGYLFLHKFIQTPDGKIFAVGEGYKRQASAGGIALKVLTITKPTTDVGATKIVITDMVMLQFDNKYRITNAMIYDKTNNTAMVGAVSDYNSQHLIAKYLKAVGSFDYEFTTGDTENSHFTVCYSDWVKSKEYKGQTFNSIRYNGANFITDKIELKSKASTMKVFPAKPGSVMIMEYFKKDKRLDFRIEKIG